MNIPTDDLAALIQRWWGSFSGRCVRRFLLMSGIDRCIVLSSQAFTSLIPLLILLSTWAPAGKGDVIARSLVNKFRVEGSAADSVEQLFTIPSGPSSSVSVASALLLVVSGASFARRIQKMYRAAWDRSAEGARSSVFAVVGLFVMLVEGALVYGIRALVRGLPYDWMWMFPVTVASGLVLWTSIPYLLLTRSVHWRRLLVTGGLSAVGTAVFGVVTAFYMPPLVTRYTNQFGLFGITIALIGWLLVASVIVVAAAAIGAEFDASRAPWAVRLQTRYHLLDPDLEPPVAVPDAAVGLDSSDLVLLLRVLVNWLILTVAVWVADLDRPRHRRTRRVPHAARGEPPARTRQRGPGPAAVPGGDAADGADPGNVRPGGQRGAAVRDRGPHRPARHGRLRQLSAGSAGHLGRHHRARAGAPPSCTRPGRRTPGLMRHPGPRPATRFIRFG